MRIFLSLVLLVLFDQTALAQLEPQHWETYLMEVNQKPVSILVNLGLKPRVPMKERPYVVILRTKINQPESNGQPGADERRDLDLMEEQLVAQLGKTSGAIYAGRFTQRGLREFYFYTLDTVGYLAGIQAAMKEFPAYQFLCQAKEDRAWVNYLQVLYPSEKDLEAILNRKQIDELAARGDALRTPRRIDHYLYFPSKTSREECMRSLSAEGFSLAGMEDKTEGNLGYLLRLYREDIPGYPQINQLFIPLWEKARKFRGKYEGWETYVVR